MLAFPNRPTWGKGAIEAQPVPTPCVALTTDSRPSSATSGGRWTYIRSELASTSVSSAVFGEVAKWCNFVAGGGTVNTIDWVRFRWRNPNFVAEPNTTKLSSRGMTGCVPQHANWQIAILNASCVLF